jgi:uncharacterized protein DUF4386
MAPRLLGAAYLGVVLTSLVSGVMFMSAAGSGSVPDVLTRLAGNETMAHVSVLVAMANCVGILVLAALLYVVLAGLSRVIAIVALACWVGEAVFYAVQWIGVAGLIPLSQDFVKVGATPDPSFQTLGAFLRDGLYDLSGTILMFFYCVGGLGWYALLYRSQLIPRVIPAYGLLAVGVGLVGSMAGLLGTDVSMLAFLPILPFELVAGAWLLIKGVEDRSATSATPTVKAPGPVALGAH